MKPAMRFCMKVFVYSRCMTPFLRSVFITALMSMPKTLLKRNWKPQIMPCTVPASPFAPVPAGSSSEFIPFIKRNASA